MRPFNWAGVVAAIVVVQALAFLWYGPLFGERWSLLMGRDPAIPVIDANNTDMAFDAISSALWAGGLAWLAQRLGVVGYLAGARLGVMAWLLFVAPTQSFLFTYAGHNRALAPIDMGYSLLAFGLTGALVAGLATKAATPASPA